jgi:Na+/glutamate symporter
MFVIPLLLPLLISLAVQFMLWLNLLFPYNFLFEGFNRNYYFVFSLSGFFAACISLVYYRLLAFERMNKTAYNVASFLQFLCLFSCVFFFIASLRGWSPI